MNKQEYLITQASWILESIQLPKLRGATATWNDQDQTAYMIYYFNGEPSEEEIEEASVASTEIIATFPAGYIKEEFRAIEYPNPLPDQNCWVFQQKE